MVAQGVDPTGLLVQGVAPVVKRRDGSVDALASVEPVPALVAAGITDVRFNASVPEGRERAIEYLSPLVAEFRAATR